MMLLWLLLAVTSQAREIPKLTGPIVDQAQVVKNSIPLEKEIRRLYQEGQVQITILIIPSLDGEVLEEYSMKVAETWQLGDKGQDNGLLLLLALQERKLRLEVGRGLEGVITDAHSSRLLRKLAPDLRKQDYDQALLIALKSIEEQIAYYSPSAVAERARQAAADQEKQERLRQQRAETWQKISLAIFNFLWIPILLIAIGFNYFRGQLNLAQLIDQRPNLENQIKSAEQARTHEQQTYQRTPLLPDKLRVHELRQSVEQAQAKVQDLTQTKTNMENLIRKYKT